MEMVMLSAVLNEIYQKDKAGNPVLFDVTFCSADRTTKKGGELIELVGVHVTSSRGNNNKSFEVSNFDNVKSKPQNHKANRTINLYSPVAQRFFKVHKDLLLVFNNQLIVW